MTQSPPDAKSPSDASSARQTDRAQAAPVDDRATLTSEQRMDRDRRAQVLARVDEVIATRATGRSVRGPGPRVVLAHRQEWFGGMLSAALAERDVEVLDVVVDGADALGIAVAERADLVLVEAVLARMPGIEVLRELQRLAPDTLCVARVAHEEGVQAMVEAGAACAWARRVRPPEVADDIVALLSVWHAERSSGWVPHVV